jgi:hypothetical protein
MSVSAFKRGEGDTYSAESVGKRLRFALSKEPNKIGVSFLSPEDGNRYNFRNILF